VETIRETLEPINCEEPGVEPEPEPKTTRIGLDTRFKVVGGFEKCIILI
jgi:hypothetical protein